MLRWRQGARAALQEQQEQEQEKGEEEEEEEEGVQLIARRVGGIMPTRASRKAWRTV